MRADRLLSLLMLLQSRGRMTARQLARELEVSVRTIYRDIDALTVAGVPVCAEPGPGGGCALIDGYRTRLTGLTEDEIRALFAISLPSALADLGLGQELRAAFLKLRSALPESRGDLEAWVRQRVYLDWSDQPAADGPVPCLDVIRQGVWEDRRLRLAYRLEIGWYVQQFECTVDPYALVARAGVWHLVCKTDGHMRVYRLSRLQRARLLRGHFTRPAEFDVATFWSAWRAGQEERSPAFVVTLRTSPELRGELPQHFGERFRDPKPDDEGWSTITPAFESFEVARARLLALGGAVEVLAPRSLRLSIADFAAQIASRYEPR